MNADYTFRVTGKLTPGLLAALDGLETRAASTDTLLVGRMVDRAALHGFIARIEALGLELVELKRLPTHRSAKGRCPECGRDGGADEQDSRATRVGPQTLRHRSRP